MTKKEPAVIFGGIAAVVGLVAANMEFEIPEEVLVMLVASIGMLVRQYVVPATTHEDVIGEATRAVHEERRRSGEVQHRAEIAEAKLEHVERTNRT